MRLATYGEGLGTTTQFTISGLSQDPATCDGNLIVFTSIGFKTESNIYY